MSKIIETTDIEKQVIKEVSKQQQQDGITLLDLIIIKKQNELIIERAQATIKELEQRIDEIATKTESSQQQVTEIIKNYVTELVEFDKFDGDANILVK